MADIAGTNLAAGVVPFTTDDTYNTHDSQYGKGGWREVATTADRDAITTKRRTAGMAVYVTSENKLYILGADLTTWTEFSGVASFASITGQPTDNTNLSTALNNKQDKLTAGDNIDITNNKISATDTTYTAGNGLTLTGTEFTANVIDNVTTTTKTDALSANMGKELQDQIDNLKARGRYLSLWNTTTGQPATQPTTLPYAYKAGDYFVVGTVAAEGGTNYKPTGTEYTGAASTTVETNTVATEDVYYFDGTVWHLQQNAQRTVTFANIAGQPTDNSNLAAALNTKLDKNTAITGATKTKITYDANGLVTAGADLAASDIPDLSATYLTPSNTKTVTNKTIDADNNTISNLETDNFKSGVVQTTVRSSSTASDTALASEKAIATAVETVASAATHKLVATNPVLHATSGICTWTISNTLGIDEVNCEVREVSSGEEVFVEKTYSTTSIVIKMNSTVDIEAGIYKAVIIG